MLNVKKDFPWFKNNSDFLYLDSSATALKPKCVIDRIVKYYEFESTNPHNTDSKFAMKLYNEIENTRSTIAQFLNCKSDEIAFNSGATEGLNLIANSLKEKLSPGDEIILTYGEHASNILPWFKLVDELKVKIKYVGEKNKLATPQDYAKLLNEKTKIVSFASGHNLTGYSFDPNEVSEIIKNYNSNIFVVVDATQSLQHRPIDLQLVNCDFLVFSGHKLFGPTGIGVTYIKKEIQNIIKPLRYGGGMNFKIDEDNYELRSDIQKYEGGTQNIAGILGLKTAIDYINSIGYQNIINHEHEIIKYAKDKLSKIKNIIIYNENNLSATIAFNYKNVFSQDLASYLGNRNIIVRSGLSCAKLYCNIIDTKSVVRASFSIYTTKEDVDRLYDVLSNFNPGDIINDIF